MKKKNNRHSAFIFFIIFLIAIFGIGIGIGISIFISNRIPNKNVLLIGWDGTQRDDLYKLLAEGKLPNLQEIIKQGNIVDIDVKTGITETKPGWAEVLTGYTSNSLGVVSNINYRSIPKGHTIFERLKNYYGEDQIATVFISGKPYNLGARGPHLICSNCYARDRITFEKTDRFEPDAKAPTFDGGKQLFEKRDGEPYYNAKNSINLYISGLNKASNVGKQAMVALDKYKNKHFFMFFHFEEPDEPGHRHLGGSTQYLDSLVQNDIWLGKIVFELKKTGKYNNTYIYITSDHGFRTGEENHGDAPNIFLATNDKDVAKNGDRKDITPTILTRFGIDPKFFLPPIAGHSLIDSKVPKATFVVRQFLTDGQGIIADQLGYFQEEGINVKTIIVEKGANVSPLLFSNEAQFGILGEKEAVLAHLKDVKGEIEIIADLGGGGRRWKIMAGKNSGIITLDDLNFKRVGSWLDSYGFARFSSYLSENNISIKPIQLRDMAPKTAVHSLANGDVDAVMVWEPVPSFIEENNVGYEVTDLEQIGKEMSVYLHVRKDFVQKNPGFTVKFLRAIKKAQDYIKANPKEAANIIAPKFSILYASSSALEKGLPNINFNLSFDDNEEKQIDYVTQVFKNMGLHNIPNRQFMKLDNSYFKQYIKNY